MIASLTMYAYPHLDGAHRRFWSLIRARLDAAGFDSPLQLSQDMPEMTAWRDPDLILSQTCGMPYRLFLHDEVQLVGTPDYRLESCPPGYYRSALLVRKNDRRSCIGDFAGARFAYNSEHSQSGFAAAYMHVMAHGFWFEHRLHTGQHLKSARAVAAGRADIAALDAVSWLLIREHLALDDELRVLDWTSPTPGLPYITARGFDASAVYCAVESGIRDLDVADREALHLHGLLSIPKSEYMAVATPRSALH